jgi:hypothetical protein
MGRTYKRNDVYRSNRPKSIREKRQFSSSKKPPAWGESLPGADSRDSPKQPRKNIDYTDFQD